LLFLQWFFANSLLLATVSTERRGELFLVSEVGSVRR